MAEPENERAKKLPEVVDLQNEMSLIDSAMIVLIADHYFKVQVCIRTSDTQIGCGCVAITQSG